MTTVDLQHEKDGVRLYVDGEDFGLFLDENSAVWYLLLNNLLVNVALHRSIK